MEQALDNLGQTDVPNKHVDGMNERVAISSSCPVVNGKALRVPKAPSEITVDQRLRFSRWILNAP
jgi:hypothetical protein